MKKGFISGKVTGLPYHEVVSKFDKAESIVRNTGLEPINPLKLIHPEAPWEDAMQICLAKLDEADAIFMLPDFSESEGACMELLKARELGINIFHIEFKQSKLNEMP